MLSTATMNCKESPTAIVKKVEVEAVEFLEEKT